MGILMDDRGERSVSTEKFIIRVGIQAWRAIYIMGIEERGVLNALYPSSIPTFRYTSHWI